MHAPRVISVHFSDKQNFSINYARKALYDHLSTVSSPCFRVVEVQYFITLPKLFTKAAHEREREIKEKDITMRLGGAGKRSLSRRGI